MCLDIKYIGTGCKKKNVGSGLVGVGGLRTWEEYLKNLINPGRNHHLNFLIVHELKMFGFGWIFFFFFCSMWIFSNISGSQRICYKGMLLCCCMHCVNESNLLFLIKHQKTLNRNIINTFPLHSTQISRVLTTLTIITKLLKNWIIVQRLVHSLIT